MKKLIYFVVVLTIIVMVVYQADLFAHNFWQDFQGLIAQLQYYLKIKMTGLVSQLRQGDNLSLMWLVGLSFMYGMIHSLGPGHGKALIASFLVAGQATPKRAVIQGSLAAFFHGFSAIILVAMIKYFAMGRTSIVFNHWSANLQIIAYSLISLLGLFCVVSEIVELVRKKNRPLQVAKKVPEWWMWLSLGLIPCPGTMIILLFFMSQKLFALGVFLAVTMAFGMAVTLGVVGLCTVYCRDYIQQIRADNRCSSWSVIFDYVGLAGASFVLFVGLVLLTST